MPGHHDLMAATQAPQAEIGAHPKNTPTFFPAGMFFFHH
jgi:hypothetical protein